MDKLTTKSYWENRYLQGGNSGYGSYGQEAAMKATMINHWIKEFDIKTIQEIGCGDGNNLLMYNVRMQYTGYDISPKAIELCRLKTKNIRNTLMYYFTTELKDIDYDADLCLCLDVWFHQLEEKDFQDLCTLLFVTGKWKYIICYTTDSNSQLMPDGTPMASHMFQREFLSKVQEYSQWEIIYWISGIQVNESQNIQFPSDKRFYLLRRKKDLQVPKE